MISLFEGSGPLCSVKPTENDQTQALPGLKYPGLILRGWREILNPCKRD
jgi:hypothetical protein